MMGDTARESWSSEDSPFLQAREILTPLEGVTLSVSTNDLRQFKELAGLVFGYKLGVLSTRTIVDELLSRMQDGEHLDDLAEKIALVLPDEIPDVRDMLEQMPDVSIWEQDDVRCSWLIWVVQKLSLLWKSGRGDPLNDLWGVETGWGEVGYQFWAEVRPRGLDRAYFGNLALRRFLQRVDDWIDGHSRFAQ